MRHNPLETLKKLIQERYYGAKTVFWAGSVSKNQGTHASDLDIVVVYEKLAEPYREAFVYDGWPIDAFVNDGNSLTHFMADSRDNSGISGLITMIRTGREITEFSEFSEHIKALAQSFYEAGPLPWDIRRIERERFLITDLLEDVVFPTSRIEQVASAVRLYEALSQFYFRAQNKWAASGKSIVKYLYADDPNVAHKFCFAFEHLFQKGETAELQKLVLDMLEPYGGLLWDGFRSN